MLRTYTTLRRTIFFHCFYFPKSRESELPYCMFYMKSAGKILFFQHMYIVLVQFINIKTIIIILSCRHTVCLYVRFPLLKFKNTRKNISRLKLPSKWERSRLNSKNGRSYKKECVSGRKTLFTAFFSTNAKLRHHDISYSVLKGFN